MLLFFCNITLHLAAEAMLLHSKIQCVCFWLILFRNTDKGRVQAHTSLQPCEMSICSLIFNRGSSLNRGTVLCFTARACSGVLKHPVFFLLQIFYFFFEYQQLNAVTSSNIHLTWKVLNEAFWIWFKEKKKKDVVNGIWDTEYWPQNQKGKLLSGAVKFSRDSITGSVPACAAFTDLTAFAWSLSQNLN